MERIVSMYVGRIDGTWVSTTVNVPSNLNTDSAKNRAKRILTESLDQECIQVAFVGVLWIES